MSSAFEQYMSGPMSAEAFGRGPVPIGEEAIRNRLGYHKGNTTTIPQHEKVREAYIALAVQLDKFLPTGRGKDIWFDTLQTSAMWANFAVAEQSPLEAPPAS